MNSVKESLSSSSQSAWKRILKEYSNWYVGYECCPDDLLSASIRRALDMDIDELKFDLRSQVEAAIDINSNRYRMVL